MTMRVVTVLFAIVLCFKTYAQEDPLYSQYQFNQLMINPSYAGIYDRFSVGLISRFQWAGLQGAPTTNTITAQSAMREGKIGVGGVLLNDRFGVSNNYEVQLSSSYNIIFPNAKLAMGMQAGLIRYGFDFNNVELDFLDDPEILNGHENFQKPNFGFGMMYLSDNFFFGASIPRILSVEVSDGSTLSERYRRHYYFTGGFVVEASRWTKFKVVSLIRSIDGSKLSADLNVSANFDEVIWSGFSTRDLKTFGLFINLLVADKMKLGYSLELPTNSLIRGNYGTHEVSILLETGIKRGRSLVKRYF